MGDEQEKSLSIGEITLDAGRHAVSVNGEPCELTFKEYELLHFLMRNAGIVMKRDVLMERIWGIDGRLFCLRRPSHPADNGKSVLVRQHNVQHNQIRYLLDQPRVKFPGTGEILSNIAVCLIQIARDGMEVHEYLEAVKHGVQCRRVFISLLSLLESMRLLRRTR